MAAICNIFIGLDVSKDELVIAYRVEGKWQKCKIPNTLERISEWLSSLGVSGKHFVLEATGSYAERLIHALAAQGAK